MPQARNDTPRRIPPLSLLLGYGPAALILLLSLLAWAGYAWAVPLARLWAAAILIFIAGVVRGLSFFTEGGPRFSQLAVMMWRFLCGLVALVVPPLWVFPVLAMGYLSALAYDTHAARQGEAPRFFAALRPPQMIVALAGLVILAAVTFVQV